MITELIQMCFLPRDVTQMNKTRKQFQCYQLVAGGRICSKPMTLCQSDLTTR